ncbi:MAG: SDR family NAD(P)-dependent oxidoreductase, partial [Pseudomonadota bacterium]
MNLSGKTVVITGASRGIGAAAAHVFAKAGANVSLIARSDASIRELAEDIGDSAIALTCDVSDYDSVKGAIAATNDAFGTVDVLVGNAGAIEPIARMDQA